MKDGGKLFDLKNNGDIFTVLKISMRYVSIFYVMEFITMSNFKKIAVPAGEKIIVSHVSYTFPFNQMAEAHLQLETGRTKGKVVVVI